MAGGETSEAIRVLLVEDDAEFADMYRLRLEADEYAVEWARSGRDGLRLAQSWRPDLIFLDIRMPEIDGLQLLRMLRRDPATSQVPVVVLTNNKDEELQREGECLGILEWILKMDTTPSGMLTWLERWSSALGEEGGHGTPNR